MEIKIREYEEQIAKLEKKVSDLEIHNSGLRECLLKNIQFSTKLSNITYEMDCLLVKKGQEIRDLEQRIEQSSKSKPSPTLMDFEIEMTPEEHEQDLVASKSGSSESGDLDANDYVETIFIPKKGLSLDGRTSNELIPLSLSP